MQIGPMINDGLRVSRERLEKISPIINDGLRVGRERVEKSSEKEAKSSNNAVASTAARSRRSVHFCGEVRCKPIPYKTPAEVQSVWYSYDDRAEFQERARRVVKRLRRRPRTEEELLATKNETMRGIEHLLSQSNLRTLQREQKEVIEAVVLLQEHWRVKGLPSNAEELAFTSQTLSAPARDRARRFGIECDDAMADLVATMADVTLSNSTHERRRSS
jgi:hypothetical protein